MSNRRAFLAGACAVSVMPLKAADTLVKLRDLYN